MMKSKFNLVIAMWQTPNDYHTLLTNANVTTNIDATMMQVLMKPMAFATNNDGEPSVSND
jgi:hypothetical protein